MKTNLHPRFSILAATLAACTQLSTLSPQPASAQYPPPDGFNPGASGDIVCSLAVQPDGKILVGGGLTNLGGQTRNHIGRLNADGTLDGGFNPGTGGSSDPTVYSLAVQADGKVLVGGGFTTLGGQTRNYIGRLNPNGTLDTAFNPGANGRVNSLAVQADGKILVGGWFTTLGGQTRNRIARLNENGSLDTGFNPGANDRVYSLAVQADWKILVGGQFTTLGGQTRNHLGRLNNTEPATQSLTFDGSTITWLRGGTSPEVWRTTFDLSTDGLTWTSLGAGTRRAGGWQRAVASSPPSGVIRARGYTAGGLYSGSGGFVESQVPYMTPPRIADDPRSVTNISGTTATFAVNATGTAPLAYHWRKDGVGLADGGNVSGARSRVLALANVQWTDAGQYTVVVTNLVGAITSRVASLTVLIPPQILAQPQSQAVALGANVLFSVTVSGTTPLYCQWRKGGVDIPGANMAALTFCVRASDLGRYSVVVWNAGGWVVSAGADLVVPDDPANGNPPSLLTYPSLPAKQPGKDSLVLLTHGWSPKFGSVLPPPDVPWLNELARSINDYLATNALVHWQVVAYEWLFNSFTWLPDSAAENGAKEGANVGCDIVNQGWSHVHLIGNSAGAALIQATTDMVKARNPSIVVHETFLDPYLRVGYPGRAAYGAKADWAESYFAHDYLSDDLGSLILQPSLTEGRLANAYNVNVTQLDPSALLIPGGTLIDPLYFEVLSWHDWPHEFYKNTVSGTQPGAEGLGFPLSMEGGGWANRGSYPRGDPPRVLGNLAMVVQNEFSTAVNGALKLAELVFKVSPSGFVQWLQNGFHLVTGTGGGPSPKGPEPKDVGGLPVWVSFAVPVTNQVNFVTFEAQFDSTNGAVGLLSVYWGTNLIGTVDERVVIPGPQQYSFALPATTPAGLYLLGFRLDPHSDVQSSVNVTNIATGFSGIAVPIQLQIACSATNSSPTITLTAAPGFYYQLQTSADLVNWTPLASVLNTNGTAQIIDTTANSLEQRFYRAVLP